MPKSVKITLDQKDPKKHVVKYSTKDDSRAVTSVYVANSCVEELGDPDAITLTVSAKE
jgi:hypothetical protein